MYGVGNYEWWEYFLIPWIAGFVGYFTNVLALYLTFEPLEFLGIELWRIKEQPWGLFGWQGIIPSKAEKMAGICFDLMTTRLFNIKEIFGKLDPVDFSKVMEKGILLLMDKVINEVAYAYMPTAWNSLPEEVRRDIVVTADQETAQFLADFMKDVQEHIDDVIDIKTMTVQKCVENKALVNKIFQECGEKVSPLETNLVSVCMCVHMCVVCGGGLTWVLFCRSLCFCVGRVFILVFCLGWFR